MLIQFLDSEQPQEVVYEDDVKVYYSPKSRRSSFNEFLSAHSEFTN